MIVDAFIDQNDAGSALGATFPDQLILGTGKHVWYGFTPGEFPNLPTSAVVHRAQLSVTAHFPISMLPSDTITLSILRPSFQYSELTVTRAQVQLNEAANQNWPMEVLQTIDINFPIAYSNPDYQGNYFTRRLDLDVTEWVRFLLADPGQLPTWGFFIEAAGIPNLPGGAPGTVILDSREADSVLGPYHLPLFNIDYGFGVTNLSVFEITDTSAIIGWDEVPGADYYRVEYSTDGVHWQTLPGTTETTARLELSQGTLYLARVAAFYKDYGQSGDFSPEVEFASASSADPTDWLTPPPAPALSIDLNRHQVTIGLPDVTTTHPELDLWQIARRRGTPAQAGGAPTLPRDLVATVPVEHPNWVDHYPQRINATYQIRGRVDSVGDKWTGWSDGAASSPSVPLRAKLASPNIVLELLVQARSINVAAGRVETAVPWRFAVEGGDTLELNVAMRAMLAGTSADNLLYGLVWYDRDGNFISESSNTQSLALLNGEPPIFNLVKQAAAPAGAYRAGIFFEIIGALTDTTTKVRIERLELYLVDPEKDTGWEYHGIPDTNGDTPDDRDRITDETSFVYDGVGWSALTGAPLGAGSTGPYRETVVADDEVTFIVSGSMVEFLYYGSSVQSVFELSRLSDDIPIQAAANPEEPLWEPVVDASVGAFSYGNNLITNPLAAVDTSGWTVANTPDPNNTLVNGATLTRVTTGVLLEGTASFEVVTSLVGQGAAWAFSDVFRAGRTYEVSFDHQAITNNSFNTLGLGSFSPLITSPQSEFLQDAAFKTIVSLTTGPTTSKFYWTPRTDVTRVIFYFQTTHNAARTVRFDNVLVREVTGYVIPATTNFSAQSIKFPPYFSNQFPTPYKVRLLSGKLRPLGLNRDTANVIDYTADFDTVLKAIGNLRNATYGELELRSDLDPKRIFHHRFRGIDHSVIPGGLDLRAGKNVVEPGNTLTSDPSQVVNRLLVIGYGDDRTQLVTELRSLKDRQGRVPSHPFYRYDADGLPPSDPNWNPWTGGTSEEIFGRRYGVFRDENLISTFRAREKGQILVELSAWPAESYDLTAVDVGDVPTVLDVGDRVPIRFRNQDKLERITAITTDISRPRALQLTLGENVLNASEEIERVAKDTEIALSFLNSATGATP